MNISASDIDALVAIFEQSKWKELDLQIGDTRIFLGRDADGRASWDVSAVAHAVTAPALTAAEISATPATTSHPSEVIPAAPLEMVLPKGCVAVTAPSIGAFYRSAKPGSAPFVELGQRVTPNTELCLIEVMKLFTTLQAGVTGTIREILAKDGDLVEAGQSLFVIDTEA